MGVLSNLWKKIKNKKLSFRSDNNVTRLRKKQVEALKISTEEEKKEREKKKKKEKKESK